MHEKLEKSELAFQVYAKIVNCDGPNSNLEFVAGSYFAMAKYHHGRKEYANSRELFLKFVICVKKMHDLNQTMGIPLFNIEPENLGKMMQDMHQMLQASGELNDMKSYYLAVI